MKLGDRIKDLEKRSIILELKIASIRQKNLDERKGDFGEEIFQTLIELKLGWIGIKDPRLDDAGIDREFRLFDARIDTQIKLSTMAQDGTWNFSLFRKGKELDKRLYQQENFYLVLIGLHCTKYEFPRFLRQSMRSDPLRIRKTIFMISGKKVIEHLKGEKTRNITINSKRLKEEGYEWLRRTRNPFKVFAREFKKQTGTEMPTPPL